jgi:hypothetical protein
MIRTFASHFSASMALAAQALLIIAACACAPAPLEDAALSAPTPPCHQSETGLRMSVSDSCCCDLGGADRTEAAPRTESASLSPFPLSVAPTGVASSRLISTPLPRLANPPGPRPPLRV